MFCSFCRQPETKVLKLVPSSLDRGICICGECIAVCNAIKIQRAGVPGPALPYVALHCSFCGENDVQMVASPKPKAYICHHCVTAANLTLLDDPVCRQNLSRSSP